MQYCVSKDCWGKKFRLDFVSFCLQLSTCILAIVAFDCDRAGGDQTVVVAWSRVERCISMENQSIIATKHHQKIVQLPGQGLQKIRSHLPKVFFF